MAPGGLASDEIAEDYKNSLEDLVINSRYEINNLTVIARENPEHALAISRVIETHILKVSNNSVVDADASDVVFRFPRKQ